MPSFRSFQTAPPSKVFQLAQTNRLLAQSASASASYETPIFAADAPCRLHAVRLTPATSITSAANGAIGLINLYRGGNKVLLDGVLGAFNCNVTSTAKYNHIANLGQVLAYDDGSGPATYAGNTGGLKARKGGIAFLGSLHAAVTAAVSTGGTIDIQGSGALTDPTILATSTITVEPWTANEESVTLSAYNTGTGVFTLANSATFAKSHPTNSLVVVQGAYLAAGTIGAVTAAVDTGATITAIADSNIANFFAATSKLIVEPGGPIGSNPAHVETIQLSAYNTGTGAFTIANSGKFAISHAATSLVVLPFDPDYALTTLHAGDVLTFKWLQMGTTGLALPASLATVHYSPVV